MYHPRLHGDVIANDTDTHMAPSTVFFIVTISYLQAEQKARKKKERRKQKPLSSQRVYIWSFKINQLQH